MSCGLTSTDSLTDYPNSVVHFLVKCGYRIRRLYAENRDTIQSDNGGTCGPSAGIVWSSRFGSSSILISRKLRMRARWIKREDRKTSHTQASSNRSSK